MTYRGHVKGGVIVLDQPATLPEGTQVRVEVVAAQPEVGDETGPTLYERLQPLIEAAEDLPPDASVNLDHYLYGHPKR